MSYTMEVAESRIAGLATRGLDLPRFWQECTEVIARVVPHFQTPCWFTLDPASLLATSHYQTELPELPREWMAYEYLETDYHSLASVARSQSGASTMFDATGGDPSRSRAWREFIRPYGGDQELLVALRSRAGAVWGVVGLYREPDRALFDKDEIGFMRAIAPSLAAGAQRGLLVGEATDPEASGAGTAGFDRGLQRGVSYPGSGAVAGGVAGRKLEGDRKAASVGAGGRRARSSHRRGRIRPGRRGVLPGSVDRGKLDGPSRSLDGGIRIPSGG
ncbi:MAG: hypothetical protein WD178_10185, partial [Actinomycetota bacterium]